MRFLIVMIAFSTIWLGGASAVPKEATAVRATLKAVFEKPGAPLMVEPVAVAENYALADWEQGEMGGRALLRKKQAGWEIVLCAGDEITKAEALRAVGVPAGIADRLSSALAEAETSVSRARLDKFSSFKGLVHMDEGSHPPHK